MSTGVVASRLPAVAALVLFAVATLAVACGGDGSLTVYSGRNEELIGPLIERIDIHVEVPAVPISALRDKQPGTASATLREQVARVLVIQRERFGEGSTTTNGRMTSKQLRKYAAIDSDGERLLHQAVSELGLSARAHDKVLRVARTIADLAGEENVSATHLSESIQYRRLDRTE